jgi:hypothetical protein
MEVLERQLGKTKGRLENKGNTATNGGFMVNAPMVGKMNYTETVERKVVEKMTMKTVKSVPRTCPTLQACRLTAWQQRYHPGPEQPKSFCDFGSKK